MFQGIFPWSCLYLNLVNLVITKIFALFWYRFYRNTGWWRRITLKGYLKIDVHSNQSFAVKKYEVSSSSTDYISKHFFCKYFMCKVFVHVQDFGQLDFITYVKFCGIWKFNLSGFHPCNYPRSPLGRV